MSPRPTSYAVAASSRWRDPDGTRLPAGEAHAWIRGTNQTACGLPLSRSALERFSHVTFADVLPDVGGAADRVARVCPRCLAATGGRRERGWVRTAPRP